MRLKLLLIFLLFLLTACVQVKKDNGCYMSAYDKECGVTPTRYMPARDKECDAIPTKYVPVPMAGQLMPVTRCKTKHLTGEAAIRSANRKAMRQPNSGEYINSIMTFDYMPGALYQIYCAPLNVTDIQFQNNEHIISVGAGDTLRWQVSKTYSGSGGTRQEHLLVKPVDDDLTNSLVITTDLRTYHLMLHSTAQTYMASVTWRYPDADGLIENLGDENTAVDNGDMFSSVDLNRMNFVYKVVQVEGKKKPDWYPRMVFNDGSKTYIKFPAQMQEAPTLFVGNNPKNDQIVNYRVAGNYYIVDSVLTQAQLRSCSTILQITMCKPCQT